MYTRGGKRQGAGRPSSESTVQMRIPVGVLDDVKALVAGYKAGINPATRNTEPDKEPEPIKPDASQKTPIDHTAIAKARATIRGLHKGQQNGLIKQFGNLEKAARSYAGY